MSRPPVQFGAEELATHECRTNERWGSLDYFKFRTITAVTAVSRQLLLSESETSIPACFPCPEAGRHVCERRLLQATPCMT